MLTTRKQAAANSSPFNRTPPPELHCFSVRLPLRYCTQRALLNTPPPQPSVLPLYYSAIAMSCHQCTLLNTPPAQPSVLPLYHSTAMTCHQYALLFCFSLSQLTLRQPNLQYLLFTSPPPWPATSTLFLTLRHHNLQYSLFTTLPPSPGTSTLFPTLRHPNRQYSLVTTLPPWPATSTLLLTLRHSNRQHSLFTTLPPSPGTSTVSLTLRHSNHQRSLCNTAHSAMANHRHCFLNILPPQLPTLFLFFCYSVDPAATTPFLLFRHPHY